MTPKDIVAKFADALEKFQPINGQASDNDLTRIREVVALLLFQIPYEETGGTHNIIGLIRTVAAYTTHYDAEFAKPTCVGAYDATIDANATAVVHARTEAVHKARRCDRGTYKTA